MAYPGRILVTGANGFVGKHLDPALQAAFPEATLHTERFDITDAAEVDRIIGAFQPDALVHLAGITAIPKAKIHPDQAWSVNLHGTLHLAHAVLSKAPACRFLHISSGDIYGASFRSGQPLDETALLAPLNTYAVTKAAADLAIGAMISDGLNAIRLRPFNHTGPGQSADFVVAAFARQIALIEAGKQEPIIRVGSLEPSRDFLDVRDVCTAYIACLRHTEIPAGTIFNIASTNAWRIGDILKLLLAKAKVEVSIETDVTRLRPMDIPTACGNSDRAKVSLNWMPEITLENTLEAVISNWRERVQVKASEFRFSGNN